MASREELIAMIGQMPEDLLGRVHQSLTDLSQAEAEPPVGSRTCRSWREFTDQLPDFPMEPEELLIPESDEPFNPRELWAFRGQANSSWKLTPSIERMGPEVDLVHAEQLMMREFKAKAHLYQPMLPPQKDTIEWRTVMQHFGLPTRLLDFTYSPGVAAYFALRDRAVQAQYAAVWAINLTKLQRAANRVCRRFPADQDGSVRLPTISHVKLALSRTPKYVQVKDENGFVVVALPRHENLRLSHQAGLFLMNGSTNLTFQESLDRMIATENDCCRCIYIDRSARQDILRGLLQMNIHELSLFPGLDGLGRLAALKAELFALRQYDVPVWDVNSTFKGL